MRIKSYLMGVVSLSAAFTVQAAEIPGISTIDGPAGAREIPTLNRVTGCSLMLPNEFAVNGQSAYTIRRYRNLPIHGGDPLGRDPNSGGYIKKGWHWVNNCTSFDYVEEDTKILVGHALLMKGPKCEAGSRMSAFNCVPHAGAVRAKPRPQNNPDGSLPTR